MVSEAVSEAVWEAAAAAVSEEVVRTARVAVSGEGGGVCCGGEGGGVGGGAPVPAVVPVKEGGDTMDFLEATAVRCATEAVGRAHG